MDSTIKAKFRQSTVDGKAGTVFYQVIHKRQMARINTDIHLLPCDWQKVNSQENLNDNLMFIRNRIKSDKDVTTLIIDCCDKSGKEYSAKTIVTLFKAKGNSKPLAMATDCPTNEDEQTSFISLIRKRIAALKEEKRNGTAANYAHTLNSFSSFADGKDITFGMVNQELMERYEAWLRAKGLKRNSISFYMRILRAVYNLAVKDGFTPQNYPFSKVFTGGDLIRQYPKLPQM